MDYLRCLFTEAFLDLEYRLKLSIIDHLSVEISCYFFHDSNRIDKSEVAAGSSLTSTPGVFASFSYL